MEACLGEVLAGAEAEAGKKFPERSSGNLLGGFIQSFAFYSEFWAIKVLTFSSERLVTIKDFSVRLSEKENSSSRVVSQEVLIPRTLSSRYQVQSKTSTRFVVTVQVASRLKVQITESASDFIQESKEVRYSASENLRLGSDSSINFAKKKAPAVAPAKRKI